LGSDTSTRLGGDQLCPSPALSAHPKWHETVPAYRAFKGPGPHHGGPITAAIATSFHLKRDSLEAKFDSASQPLVDKSHSL
jgi:hypothetical protein